MKRTKIVCTIGPASQTKSMIEKMIKAGLNVARLNFSHNTWEHHSFLIRNIRAVAKKLETPIAILQDLQGPRIRIGDLPMAGIELKRGMVVILVPENYKIPIKSLGIYLPIQYPQIYRDLKPGDPVLIDDATIALEVLAIKNKTIKCKVKIGGIVKSRRGMNFPKSNIRCPALTKKDLKDVWFGLKKGVDFIALSFVKDSQEIINLRRLIYRIEKKLGHDFKDFLKPQRKGYFAGTHTRIIAKIERKEAVKNFDQILEASDGIMIARGDLGIEIPLEDVPLIQKKIIKKCIQVGKPVIVATQMLESMIKRPVPTRAEVSDIANAILDGTDAIMLSGETATGRYPLKAVQVMAKISHEVEGTEITESEKLREKFKKTQSITEAVSYAVPKIAEQTKAKLIVCATTSGFTARSIVKYKPTIRVVALAASEKTKNQLCLSWGVTPYFLPFTASFNQLIFKIKNLLVKEKLVKKGDIIVITAGHPFGYLGQTNLVKVEKI